VSKEIDPEKIAAIAAGIYHALQQMPAHAEDEVARRNLMIVLSHIRKHKPRDIERAFNLQWGDLGGVLRRYPFPLPDQGVADEKREKYREKLAGYASRRGARAKLTERNTAIARERKEGATLAALGKKHGLSRMRISQICRAAAQG